MPGLVRGAVTGLAAAAGVLLVTAGYPLWVQFHGPLVEQGSPWTPGHFRNRPGDFVNGPSGVLLHSQATVAYLDQHAVRMVEYFAYLGWPMLVVLVLAAVCFWRDLRVRALAVAFAVLEVLSLGSRTVVVRGLHIPATLMPWHYLQGLPLLSQSLPNRFSLLADGAAAVVLAFSLDLAWGRRATGRRPPRRRMPCRRMPRHAPVGGCPGRACLGRGCPGRGCPGRAGCPGRPGCRAGGAAPPTRLRLLPPAGRKAAAVYLLTTAWPWCPSSRFPCRRPRSSRPRQAGSRPSPGCRAGRRRRGSGPATPRPAVVIHSPGRRRRAGPAR